MKRTNVRKGAAGIRALGVIWGIGFPGLMEAGPGAAGWTNWPEVAEVEPLEEIREVSEALWERRAICYSGYREGQSPREGQHPTDEQVLEDLRILEEAGFGLLRVYSAQVHGRQVVEGIATAGLDLRVQLGAYLTGPHEEDGEENVAEMEAAIELANRYGDIVMGVSVGNEVLVDWSFVPVPAEQMVAYVDYVRERIEQPVTVNDNWEPYAVGPEDPRIAVWSRLDYASVHTYAYWDAGFRKWPFRQNDVAETERAEAQVEAAVDYALANVAAVREALDAAGLEIPVVIGETGWQNVPSAVLEEAEEGDFARVLAGKRRQLMYYRRMSEWIYGEDGKSPGDGFMRPSALFYFAAFDEPWKEADDNWGLWDVDREPKHEGWRRAFLETRRE